MSAASSGPRPNLRGIMLDTQGPEIRTGQFPDGAEVALAAGSRVVVTVDEAYRTKQSKDKIWITYKDFPLSTHPGARWGESHKLSIQLIHNIWFKPGFPISCSLSCRCSVLIEDGILELRVVKVLSDTDVECEVANAATLGNKKNVNLPGQKITLPAISDKDKSDLM
jgi:pyruvate kinase